MAEAPTVLILVIDQMIRADEEIFLKVGAVIVQHWPVCRQQRSIVSITPESPAVTHSG